MAATAIGTVLQSLRCSYLRQDDASDAEMLERFIARRDEGAFEAILRLHGPMVLGVCRRVARNEADAEDAFQATFLVLIRKASSVRPRNMVGNWLHGVAFHTALKARAMSSKRSAKEREASAQTRTAAPDNTNSELQSIFDQELQGLPDIYRSAIVICDLEGLAIKDAARQLNCPPGTLGARLTRGRRLLSRRLTRRGVTLPAGLAAFAIAQTNTEAGVPPLLMKSMTKAAAHLAAGQAAIDGTISARVAALTEGAIKTMLLSKLKSYSIPLVAIVCAIAVITGTIARNAIGDEPPPMKKDLQQVQGNPPVEVPARRGQAGPVRAASFVWSVAFDPKGKWIAVSEGNNLVRQWDTASQQPGAALVGPEKIIRSLAVSPDGRYLAAGGDEGTLFIWEIATRKLVQRLAAGAGFVLTVAFSPDGASIVSACQKFGDTQSSVMLWDVKSGEMRQRYASNDGTVPFGAGTAIAFSPDGKELATLQEGKFTGVKFYNVENGREVNRFEYEKSLRPQSIAISPDGRWLATGGIAPPMQHPNDPRLFGNSHGHVKIWNLKTSKVEQTLFDWSEGHVNSIAFSKDGNSFFAATTCKLGQPMQTNNGLVQTLGSLYQCWDVSDWKVKWDATSKGGEVFGTALSRDGKRLAVANSAGFWLFPDTATGRDLRQIAFTPETPGGNP